MITHLVLFRPKPDLTASEGRVLLETFVQAATTIPSVQGVRIGRRVTFGHAYEAVPQPDHAFVVELDFVDPDGLNAYLRHPVHGELASRFYGAVAHAHAYDFDVQSDPAGLTYRRLS